MDGELRDYMILIYLQWKNQILDLVCAARFLLMFRLDRISFFVRR
jgi:hypothetical protein